MAIIVQLLEGCKEINDKLNTVLKLGVSEERVSFNKEDLMRHEKEVNSAESRKLGHPQ